MIDEIIYFRLAFYNLVLLESFQLSLSLSAFYLSDRTGRKTVWPDKSVSHMTKWWEGGKSKRKEEAQIVGTNDDVECSYKLAIRI